jgi:hypothetical protein
MNWWDWSDAAFAISFLTLVATLLVAGVLPLTLWYWSRRDNARLQTIQNAQAQILRRQRRDALLDALQSVADRAHLEVLWTEVREFRDVDLRLLRSAFRINPSVPLPGASPSGVNLDDHLDAQAVTDYVRGLERRFLVGDRSIPFDGLTRFLAVAQDAGFPADISAVAQLVTGQCAHAQHPGHRFYRDLVNLQPRIAGSLLYRVEDIDSRAAGGLRLNVLTGVFLALKDAELGRPGLDRADVETSRTILRENVPTALAQLLDRGGLRSFDHWALDGYTEPVSATVAWLVRAVGWLCDVDGHLGLRMVQNLAWTISSIPIGERRWGVDSEDVVWGFEAIAMKQPTLWADYGDGLERAADEVGEWR